jgi:protein-disulfide isomerase
MSKQATLQQRREARIAAERAAKSREQRGRRLRLLAAAAAAAAVLVTAAALISHSGGHKSASTAAQQHPAGLFAGLKETNGVIGSKSAPLTVTEYLDLQCPVCRQASTTTVPTLVNDYVKTGKIRLQARTLHFIGADSDRAAEVAAGAEKQGKLWPFIEAFYANQQQENSGYVTNAFLTKVAGQAGVDAKAAIGQANSNFATGRLRRADSEAAALKVTGTPTLVVQRGNGAPHVLNANPLDPASVASALNKELKG